MTTSFVPGSLLWVKLDGYPWWPAQALDSSYLDSLGDVSGFTNPLAILYLGSNEVGCVDADGVSVVDFDLSDEEKVDGCSGDSTLESALDSAKSLLSGAAVLAEEEDGSSDDDEDDEDGDAAAAGEANDDDLLLGGADDGEEQASRRKKEKKDKKDKKKDKKDKKKDKKDKKKDKKHRRDEDDAEDTYKKFLAKAAEKESKRHRSEKDGKSKASKSNKHGDSSKGKSSKHSNTNNNNSGEEDYLQGRPSASSTAYVRPFERMDIDDADLISIVQKIHRSLQNRELVYIRECLSDLSSVNVTFEQLRTTGVGVAVGLICDAETSKSMGVDFAPLQEWAETLIRYWFSQIPDRHRTQLTDMGDVDHASVASNEDAASVHSDDEFAKLDALGLAIERVLTDAANADDALLTAEATLSAPELALEIQLAIERLDADHRAPRGIEVISALQQAGHTELRRKLFCGELSVDDFVNDPIHRAMNTQERRAFEAHEAEAGKAMDITGEKERIEHAIATAEIVEK